MSASFFLSFSSCSQFLCDKFDSICKIFKRSDLVNSECKRRVLSKDSACTECLTKPTCESPSVESTMWLVVIQDDKTDSNSIKIEKYNTMAKRFNEYVEIALGDSFLEKACTVVRENNAFILGGWLNSRAVIYVCNRSDLESYQKKNNFYAFASRRFRRTI